MQVVFIKECKSCEISNQMFFSVTFSFSKIKDGLVITKVLHQLFSGAISHGASNELEAYLECSQTVKNIVYGKLIKF